MSDNLIFRYEEIKGKGGLRTRLTLPGSRFPNAVTQPNVLKDVEVSLSFSVGSDSLLLEGEVKSRMEFICSRCAERFEGFARERLDEVYENSQETIDLAPLIAESITLSEPLKPLCSEKCKGFKGVENSENSKKSIDNPFKILKNMSFGGKKAKNRTRKKDRD